MSERQEPKDLRARGEEALGELAQAVFENPLVGRAIRGGLEASERAAAAQRSALRAANVAALDDVQRLEQRLRSLAARLEELEDAVDELVELAAERRAWEASQPGGTGPGAAGGGAGEGARATGPDAGEAAVGGGAQATASGAGEAGAGDAPADD